MHLTTVVYNWIKFDLLITNASLSGQERKAIKVFTEDWKHAWVSVSLTCEIIKNTHNQTRRNRVEKWYQGLGMGILGRGW